MKFVDINSFSEEKQCTYDGELYSVRDNGAIFRHSKEGKRVRPNDNKWTFGKESKSNPYLHISNARIHRIVATAFHGSPPDPKYVVDHIDTNCRNNRPDNLRWLTRLENALKNPFTRKKIEHLCGSVEAFLENPSMLNELQTNPSFSWMRTVTPEEAKNCKERMNLWLSKPSKKVKNKKTFKGNNISEKTIYKPLKKWEVFGREPGLELSRTPRCGHYMWKASVYFPQCPAEFNSDPLFEYYEILKLDEVFAYSDNKDLCPKLTLISKEYISKSSSFLTTSQSDNSIFITGVQLDQRSGYFIHFFLGSYSNMDDVNLSLGNLRNKDDWWGASISMF